MKGGTGLDSVNPSKGFGSNRQVQDSIND